MTTFSRREWLVGTGAVISAAALARTEAAEESKTNAPTFHYCLNTSTIRGQKLGIVQEIELASKAGYDAIEPWVRDIDAYQKEGGSLTDLRKRIEDAELTVESAIGFAPWIVDDEATRNRGLEQAKREMDMLAAIGGKRIAAPPVGATKQTDLDLFAAAERYRKLCEVGDQTGVVPQVEVWGFSKSLSRLGESVFVAIESGHPSACLLPDVYHIYKGGSDFAGLKMLGPEAVHVFHMNDYPATPPRKTIGDRDRVFPGDGVAPLSDILQLMHSIGFNGVLSLELFNPKYWEQDAFEVAQTGLRKMQDAVGKAFST
ncbi:sugar phosphate isomerase/epimerase family protein [Thalassoroseus pseudoceratinae]|uniref:sugar phosphate isomerase/epimerase family protein n=1 Tax=Thalassoroseus pseudoceratinae TaxID=2713176 RepID=UPI001422C310|nr:sugar phosphate isomerase/epimerase family protein [Thalassoroseus pseudoceratinae]